MTSLRQIPRTTRIVTAPALEPVSLAQARAWCRIDADVTGEDWVLALLIAAARERAEQITGRALVERDVELVMDDLPDDDAPIELPFSPVQYVNYVRYTDVAGAAQELSGSPTPWILAGGDTAPARLTPLYGQPWPVTRATVGNVSIGYRAGYAPVGSPRDEAAYQYGMPKLIINWLAARIATFYENREQVIVGGQVQDMPRDFVDGLLDGLILNRRFA